MEKVDPLAWAQLPHDAQRILSGRPEAVAINLWFEDDGTLAISPETAGEQLGMLLIGPANYLDALRCAVEFTASLVRNGRSKSG
jgi:hypothetical protein